MYLLWLDHTNYAGIKGQLPNMEIQNSQVQKGGDSSCCLILLNSLYLEDCHLS